jgi:SAM-dependent methyltransferase
MDRILYDRMGDTADRHWWYVARREILSTLIAREIAPKPGARILEVGCGTGHNLPMLGRFGTVTAIELDADAREMARARTGLHVHGAALPALTGFEERGFDLVAALDVIEHVDEDVASLATLADRLAPGGRMLVTVPALQWLWSAHDVTNHHKRRYTARTLRDAVAAAGLKIELLTYFNSLLFPLAAASRIAGKITGREGSDDALPSAPVNRLLRGVFGLERHLVGRVKLPVGVSLVAILSPMATCPSAPRLPGVRPAMSATM